MRGYVSFLPVVLADTCTPLVNYGDVYEYNPLSKERTFSSAADVTDPIWTPETADANQWMEIPIPPGAQVMGVRTQGRPNEEWVSSYGLWLKEKYTDDWYLDTGDASGNIDGNAITDYNFTIEYGTRFSSARIVPRVWHKGISMKAHLLLRDELKSGNPYPTKVSETDAKTVFSGVGKFQGKMTCTAFYIDTSSSNDAYALSAGHCTQDFFSFMGVMNVVAEDMVWPITFKLNSDSPVRVNTTRVEYATMQGIDVSLVKLSKTKQEMSDLGIQAFLLAEALPKIGEAVRIVGVPSGDVTMQHVGCQHLGLADIAESSASWESVVKNDCAGIREGFSGSPMLDAEGRVYSIVSTTTIGAISETCYTGNPCEVTGSKPTGAQICNETNYGAQAMPFNGCFDKSGFDSSLSTCALKQKIGTDRLIPTHGASTPVNLRGSLLWDVEVPTGWDSVKYKQGAAHTTRCEDEAGWSEAIIVGGGQPLKNISVVDQEGLYRFCVVGKKASGDFQPFNQSTYFVTFVDKTTPTRIPVVNPSWAPTSVEPIFDVPELADFRYYLPNDENEACPTDTKVYHEYMRFPFNLEFHNQRTALLCLQGADYASHWGSVHRFLVVNRTASSHSPKTEDVSIMV